MPVRNRTWAMVLLLAAVPGAWAQGQVTEAHSGTRKGTVYEATPQAYEPAVAATPAAGNTAAASNGGGAVSPAVQAADGASAPSVPGAGVEIISGGASNAGAARVGQLPVLQ